MNEDSIQTKTRYGRLYLFYNIVNDLVYMFDDF